MALAPEEGNRPKMEKLLGKIWNPAVGKRLPMKRLRNG